MKTESKDGKLIVTLPENWPWEPVPDNTDEVMQQLAGVARDAIQQRVYESLLSDNDISHLWKVGDIVTRDGTDEHEIVAINECGDLLDLVCIKEPDDKWIRVGETDSNLTRRYSFVRPGKESK